MGLISSLPADDPVPVEALDIPAMLTAPAVEYANRPPVGYSKDLARVVALPRRPRPTALDLRRADLRLPASAWPDLWLEQAWALSEAPTIGGMLAQISVGRGKTLISVLLPMVFPACRTALLLIPANMVEAFDRAFGDLRKSWRTPNRAGHDGHVKGLLYADAPVLHVYSYNALSRPDASALLDRIAPDLIILDEAQNLRDPKTARTKRFRRYFSEHPETRCCAMSGSLTTRSLKDFAHLAEICLRDGSPLPLEWGTVEEWAGAIDAQENPSPPGRLRERLCAEGEDVRDGFGRRLADTPGVITSSAKPFEVPLRIAARHPPPIPAAVEEALRLARSANPRRPDGEELVDAFAVNAVARSLAAGLYHRWKYPRGEPAEVIDLWFERRQAWNRELRERLKTSRQYLDSPHLCTQAAIRWHSGFKLGDTVFPEFQKKTPEGYPTWAAEAWPNWRVVMDTVEPEPEVQWIDDWLCRDAADWAKSGIGIVWVETPEVGRKIARLADIPYYGGGPLASRLILDETGERSIVASIKAHGTGKNLQRAFSRNLVAQCPASGTTWEQLIGRTHRSGQSAEIVEIFVYLHTVEMLAAFDTARRDAEYQTRTTRTPQKLLTAEIAL